MDAPQSPRPTAPPYVPPHLRPRAASGSGTEEAPADPVTATWLEPAEPAREAKPSSGKGKKKRRKSKGREQAAVAAGLGTHKDDPKFEAVRNALQQYEGVEYVIEHVDITCDGCEEDPIIGIRYKCTVCADRDLCARCMEGLDKARAAERSEGSTGRYEAIKETVPCLDPSHVFTKMESAERSVRYTYRGDAASLHSFLASFPPASCSSQDLAWVCLELDQASCSCPPHAPPTAHPSNDSVEALRWAYAELVQAADEGGEGSEDGDAGAGGREDAGLQISPDMIDSLARSHGVLGGKWMSFPATSAVDRAWEAITQMVVRGEVGWSAKVSSKSPLEPTHALCVYTTDYQDRDDVERVLNALRSNSSLSALVEGTWRYKPDVYSILGIYSGSKLGLKASIYEG